jgi:hypothetical protein
VMLPDSPVCIEEDSRSAGAPGIILEFLRWFDSESIYLAGDDGPGELIPCGWSKSELIAKFISRGDRSREQNGVE